MFFESNFKNWIQTGKDFCLVQFWKGVNLLINHWGLEVESFRTKAVFLEITLGKREEKHREEQGTKMTKTLGV